MLLHIGTMPKELTRKNTELFAKEVLPAIKPLYSEYEDPWWPDSLKQGSHHAVEDKNYHPSITDSFLGSAPP